MAAVTRAVQANPVALNRATGRAPRAAAAPSQPSFQQFAGLKSRTAFPSCMQMPKSSDADFRQAVKSSTAVAATGGAPREITRAMNIVFVSAEVAPWSKTGGLGDVVGGLPVELAKRGHKVMTIAPRYDQYKDAWDTNVIKQIDDHEVRYFHTKKQGVDRVWVDNPLFLAKVWGKTGSKLYGKKSGSDYSDNQQRFLLFNKAAIEAVRVLPFGPGEDCVVVANDWHTALLPVLIKDVYQPKGEFLNLKVAMCVHNIAFQGRFWQDTWKELDLPESSFSKFAFEDGYKKVFSELESPSETDKKEALGEPGTKYRKINWLKAGFLSADKLLTVSPNYATEVMENEQRGVELHSTILDAGGIEGIVNGMDVSEWSPSTDKYLDVKFDKDTVAEGKAIAKETLQAELGLPVDPDVPLFGFIGRLEEQKGVDILLESLPAALKTGKLQVAVLGTGKKALEMAVEGLEKKFPDVVKGIVKFSAPLAHLITAGADFMMVPSRFEPCGLIQLHAMQYGTVPLVASTGGLVDTVKEGVTGFHMGTMDPDDLLASDAEAVAATMTRAAETYATPKHAQMRAKCIGQDLSWKQPAKKWEAILEELTFASPETAWNKNSVDTPVQQIKELVAA